MNRNSSSPRRKRALHSGIRGLLCFTLAVLFLSEASSANDPPGARSQTMRAGAVSNDVVPGVVVIKFRHSFSVPAGPVARAASPLLTAISERGVSSLARAFPLAKPLGDADVAAGKVDLSQIHYGTLPPGMDPLDVAAQLAKLPQVEYAEPKYYSYLVDLPNDPDFPAMQQVYFDRMNAQAGWTLQMGSADVVIAIVDGGTNWQHPDLKQNIWINPGEDLNHNGVYDQFPAPAGDLNSADDDHDGFKDDIIGWNFTNDSNFPRGLPQLPLSANHGTKTASLCGAVTNNGQGMAGSSWNCRIMAVCAADPVYDDVILYGYNGIAYAAAKGAQVINCSWARPGGPATFSQMEQDVITAATQAGALVVAAAGNSHQNNDDMPYYPASYDHVLSVGATEDTSDAIAYFSDYGLNISAFAPGMRIRVALDNGSYGTDQGTSDASPLVAGLAGLLKSAHPNWMPEQIAEQIRMTADPIDGSNPAHAGSLGHGRVNFGRALSEVHSGIVVTAWGFHKRSDTATPFMTGDTVILSLKLKNALTIAAENLSFIVSADPALTPLAPIIDPTRLDAGVEDSLDIAFRVDDLARGKDVFVRLSWNANTDEQDAHMFKTTVYARTGYWKHQTSPTTYPLSSVHAVNKSVVWATGSKGISLPVVLRTTDGGDNWANVTGDLPGVPLSCIFAVDSSHAWAGDWGGRIFATVNGGFSWTRQEYPPPLSYYIDGFWFANAANGYALGDPWTGTPNKFVILRTSDGGATWNHLANEPVGEGPVVGLTNAFCSTDGQHFWFGASNSRVYRTTDGGDTWSTGTAGTGLVLALAMRDDSVGIACTVPPTSNGLPSFARTRDGGVTWQTLQEVKPEWGSSAAFPAGSSRAWVGGGNSVAFSSDNGDGWVIEGTDSLSGYLQAMSFADPANGWMVTSQGEILHYHDLSNTTAVAVTHEGELPVQPLLQQNFPNPFNPGTTIQFALPHHANVSLLVFNALGQHVATLFQGEKEAGYHQVKFDAAGLASGVYFYQLRAGGYVTTKKLLHVK